MHILLRKYVLLVFVFLIGTTSYAQSSKEWLDKGWQELIRDNDTTALEYFGEAYLEAVKHEDIGQKGLALLHMGFCSYGYSYTNGLSFCNRAMVEFQKLEKTDPAKALEGRSRCLQLLSTIKARQDLYRESIQLSMEAMKSFLHGNDTTGSLGLIYNSIGFAYGRLKMEDSAAYYHKLALEEHQRTRNFTYLPTAYIRMAEIERIRNNKERSMYLYAHAMTLADSTHNRQAQVAALVGMGEWYWAFEKDFRQAELRYLEAENVAAGLTDKSFAMKAARHLLDLYKEHGDLEKALSYQEIVTQIRDSLYSWDKRKEMKTLEIQFDVAEKDRQLNLVKKQRQINVLRSYILVLVMLLVTVIGVAIFVVDRKSKDLNKKRNNN
jgi:tetratricopeptide (TPR) repeat protein